MSQSDFGNLSSPLDPYVFFDSKLEPWRDALHTNHSGSSRPSYAVAKMTWMDTTTSPIAWKYYDGADDITFGLFNETSNTFGLVAATVGPNTTQRHTLPAVTSDTVALLAATQTLTNKTINLTNNTLSGTKSQFDTACSDDNFAFEGKANTFTAQQGLGFGATFGNTARAGTTVLDWYEEVAFSSTVAIAGSSSAGTASYTTRNGFARRVGDMVFFSIFLNWNSHTGTGNIRITGLPFTAAAIDQPVNVGYISDVAMTAGRFPGALVSGGSTTIFLYEINPAGVAAQVPIDAAGALAISGMYLV